MKQNSFKKPINMRGLCTMSFSKYSVVKNYQVEFL